MIKFSRKSPYGDLYIAQVPSNDKQHPGMKFLYAGLLVNAKHELLKDGNFTVSFLLSCEGKNLVKLNGYCVASDIKSIENANTDEYIESVVRNIEKGDVNILVTEPLKNKEKAKNIESDDVLLMIIAAFGRMGKPPDLSSSSMFSSYWLHYLIGINCGWPAKNPWEDKSIRFLIYGNHEAWELGTKDAERSNDGFIKAFGSLYCDKMRPIYNKIPD